MSVPEAPVLKLHTPLPVVLLPIKLVTGLFLHICTSAPALTLGDGLTVIITESTTALHGGLELFADSLSFTLPAKVSAADN